MNLTRLGLKWRALKARSRGRRDPLPEESSTYGWHRYAGTGGAILAMETFGASAPIQRIQAKFGFAPGHVIEAAKEQLARWRRE
jgi:transketolase